MGVNRQGVVAGILNRRGSLGPMTGKRSRGELVLRALSAPSAKEAAADLASVTAENYRSFNLIVVDRYAGYWLRHRGAEGLSRPEVFPLAEGFGMVTAGDLNDLASPRIRRYLPLLKAAPLPNLGLRPDRDDWSGWRSLLVDRGTADSRAKDQAAQSSVMNLELPGGFGTVCSSLIAVSSSEAPEIRWLFAAGRPDEVSYDPVKLPA